MDQDTERPEVATAMAEAIARTGQQYDAIPYTSLPVALQQPANLCAVARLFGLAASPAPRARVLEIGCASGGHLIPIAAIHPECRCVGVDVSPVQVADGQARIARLGLANISLSARSFTDLGDADGSFDYVICHGVYSWIAQELRDALFRVCRERLNPDGVAVISYNVLPGWRMLQVVRDSILLHAGGPFTYEDRIARTRQLFEQMSQVAEAGGTYGSLWRREAQRLVKNPNSYLAHELFEENNVPVTFTAFVNTASAQGLGYLSEAQVAANIPEAAGAAAGKAARELGGGKLLAVEQYLDIVTGRTFRRSLLVHADRMQHADRSLTAERADELHFIAPLRLKIVPAAGAGAWTISDGESLEMEIADPVSAAATERLIARLPQSSSIDDLAPKGSATERKLIRSLMMQLVCAGVIDVSSEPVRCAIAAAERPKAWRIAASDAAAGMEFTATLRYGSFRITPQARLVLPLADGTRNREELAAAAYQSMLDNDVRIADAGKPITDPQRLMAICRKTVESQLEILAQVGLLVEK